MDQSTYGYLRNSFEESIDMKTETINQFISLFSDWIIGNELLV